MMRGLKVVREVWTAQGQRDDVINRERFDTDRIATNSTLPVRRSIYRPQVHGVPGHAVSTRAGFMRKLHPLDTRRRRSSDVTMRTPSHLET
jgi:hypothetical protein